MASEVFALDNARIWPGDGREFLGHVVVEGEIIRDVQPGLAPRDLSRIDLGGQALSPGLIDLMVLGGFGRSILRDDPLEIGREYLRLGVTACQLCIGTLPWDSMGQVVENTRRAQTANEMNAAEILGLYLEGPFQQPELTGASLREFALPPSTQTVWRLISEFGETVTMVNVAPGLPGDAEAVAALRSAGKTVSMAHSDTSAARIEKCLEAGTTVLGHAWDNNSGRIGDSGVQQPTLEHVAMVDERVRFIHLICDGVHVDPILVRLLVRSRGIETLCLVTDAVPLAGRPDGEYVWDDGRKFSKKGGVGRTDKGWLTGSALLLPDMLRNLINFTGLAPAQAVRAVTSNPARSLRLEGQMGEITPGARADLVVWNERMQVTRVWRAGREVEGVVGSGEVELGRPNG